MCALTHVYVQNIIYIKRYKNINNSLGKCYLDWHDKNLIGLTRQEQQDC